MKVALLGAPGSGKTKLANALIGRLNGGDFTWQTVDHYITKLVKRTGLPYDYKADFPQNVAVMTERWNAEAQARKHYANTITCGTIYETYAYALAVNFPRATSETQLIAQVEYLDVCWRFLGAMEDTTADYDLLFYLPLKDPNSDTWHGVIDQKIPEILEAEFRRAYTLSGTTKERVNAALEKIEEVRAVQSASEAFNATDSE